MKPSIEEQEHHIRRERLHIDGPDDAIPYFYLGDGSSPPATKSKDVDLTYHRRILWKDCSWKPLPVLDFPDCPDCGGQIRPLRVGGVPGSLECSECGSRYVDTAYGMAAEVPE